MSERKKLQKLRQKRKIQSIKLSNNSFLDALHLVDKRKDIKFLQDKNGKLKTHIWNRNTCDTYCKCVSAGNLYLKNWNIIFDEDIKENLCQGCEKAKKIYDLT